MWGVVRIFAQGTTIIEYDYAFTLRKIFHDANMMSQILAQEMHCDAAHVPADVTAKSRRSLEEKDDLCSYSKAGLCFGNKSGLFAFGGRSVVLYP